MSEHKLTVGQIKQMNPTGRTAKEALDKLVVDLKAQPKAESHMRTKSVESHRKDNNDLRKKHGTGLEREVHALYRLHSVMIDILEELRDQSEWVKEQAGK